jgi:hypothetical protein
VFGAAGEALKWASAYHADLVVADYRLPTSELRSPSRPSMSAAQDKRGAPKTADAPVEVKGRPSRGNKQKNPVLSSELRRVVRFIGLYTR